MTSLEVVSMPGAEGWDGIHLSAQLRVDAMQLRAHGIGWAAACMERAASRIGALEDLIVVLTNKVPNASPAQDPAPAPGDDEREYDAANDPADRGEPDPDQQV